MNWETAKRMLRNGAKITRPNWEENHYWALSKDGFEKILGYDGTNARIHLKQTEAKDWMLWREEITTERIQKEITSFLLESENRPNVINFGGVKKTRSVGMNIYGMEIRTDESLRDGEFEIGYEKPKERTLWNNRIGNPHYFGDAFDISNVKESIKKLEKQFDDWEIDEDVQKRVLNKIFGDKLC